MNENNFYYLPRGKFTSGWDDDAYLKHIKEIEKIADKWNGTYNNGTKNWIQLASTMSSLINKSREINPENLAPYPFMSPKTQTETENINKDEWLELIP